VTDSNISPAIQRLIDSVSSGDPDWVKLDPGPTTCTSYGTGSCCFDFHFDMKAILPNEDHPNLCRQGYDYDGRTDDKSKVNCKRCIEVMRS
jgi:hypothetical protein